MSALQRPILGGLLSIFMLASVAHGASDSAPAPNTKLLSYSQLMSLSESKRETYLKEVRAILVDLANRRGKSGLLTESARELDSQIALIDALMSSVLPKASAEDPALIPAPPPAPSDKKKNKNKGKEEKAPEQPAPAAAPAAPKPDESKAPAPAAAPAAEAKADPPKEKDTSKYVPYLNLVDEKPVQYKKQMYCDSELLRIVYVDGQTGYCRTDVDNNEDCPPGFIAVAQNDKGTFQCATRASFKALPENVRADLVKPNGPKEKQENFSALWKATQAEFKKAEDAKKPVDLSEVVPTYGKHGFLGISTTWGCQPTDKLLFVSVKNLTGNKADGFCRTIGDTTTSCPEGFIGVNQRANGTFNCANRASFEKLPKEVQDKLRAPHSAAPKEKQEEFKNMTLAPRKTEEKTGDKAQAGSNSCKMEKKECGGDLDELRAEYVKSGQNACIYAGNMSSYKTATPTKGKCKEVNSFTLAGKQLKCPKGQKICNPLVFGVERDSDTDNFTAICTPETARATADCNDRAMDADDQKKLMKDLLSKNVNGIAEEWDKFAEGFNNLCHKDASRNFFCTECNLIQDRVLAINVNATGDSCGKMAKFEDYKGRNGGEKPAPAKTEAGKAAQ